MSNTTIRFATFQLALVASAAVAPERLLEERATRRRPPRTHRPRKSPSAPRRRPDAAPVPVAGLRLRRAPVVVAQNTSRNAYEQGRRDQPRRDAPRHRTHAQEAAEPRADRDRRRGAQQRYRHEQQVAAAACQECGVVASVTAVEVQGKTNGVGAVAGGVGGALVGSRIAGGGNRTLGGVVGAVGGGLMGNAIEKHQRKATTYDVTCAWKTARTARCASPRPRRWAKGARRGRRPAPARLRTPGSSFRAKSRNPRPPRRGSLTARRMTALYLAMADASASVGADWFMV